MAEAAISSLVKLLGDVVIDKVKFLQGVEGQVRRLEKQLKMMQAFLKDANKKQYEDDRVLQWISEIRELAQDAEDTIEMFVVNVENKRNQGLLKKCISFPTSVNHLERLGDEIDSILKDLKAIEGRRITYGIKDLGEAAAVDSAPVERRRRQIEQHPVGLEDDVRMLLQNSILDEEKRGLSIAVVEGMGGIGKSTLARKIYNHPDVVGGRFECRAWVVVSSEYTPQETIKQLILEVAGSQEEIKKIDSLPEEIKKIDALREEIKKIDSLSEEIKKIDALREEIKKLEDSTKDNLHLQQKLKEMLHEQLQAKTYFIVLDDVWEEHHWESLKDAFPTTTQQDKRSRLLITTRNGSMRKYGQYAHKMERLNREKSWELFLNNALVDGKCPENLESVGRQILEKCDGLPLAINVVGGLLMGTRSESAWEQVLGKINSLLGIGESSVLSILELSYQNLSPQLKSCFMCLAFFKEDEIISVTRLINIWIVQGLIIQQQGTMRVHEIARGYLDELINLNMVQIKDLTSGCRVKTCQVHDLVREVCLRKAKEEIGLEILKAEEQTTSTSIQSSSKKTRHCVTSGDNLVRFSLQHNKHLRSLFLVDASNVSTHKSHWKSFQLLKIIDLGNCRLEKLPGCFRTLIGLKYLGSDSISALHLPRWLEDLKKLEVIDMKRGSVVFPKGKMKLESLRYFRADDILGVNSIEDWKNIETLRNIDIEQLLSPELIGSYCRIRELGIHLPMSPKLNDWSRVQPLLEKMDNLVKLHINWIFFLEVETALVGSRLTKLKLKGDLIKCPSVNVFPPKLSHLTLDESFLEEDPMIELGKLPNLVFLKLSCAYKGKRMKVLHDGFPRLEALSLYHLTRLKGIDIEEGGMSHLTHIRIRRCIDLNTQNLPKHITISIIN